MEALEKIANVVSEITGIDIIQENSRKREVVDAKRIYGHLARKLTVFSDEQIGELIGKDRCTIIHYRRTSEGLLESDKEYHNAYNQCLEIAKDFDCKNMFTSAYQFHLEKARYYRRKLKVTKNE
jgi:chromosomal replication initiation ATPase DnaA